MGCLYPIGVHGHGCRDWCRDKCMGMGVGTQSLGIGPYGLGVGTGSLWVGLGIHCSG